MKRPDDPMEILTIFLLMGATTFVVWLWFIFFEEIHGKRGRLERFIFSIIQFFCGLGIGGFWISFIIFTWISKEYFPIFTLTFPGVIVGFWIARKRWKILNS
jgi:hypothetical protein